MPIDTPTVPGGTVDAVPGKVDILTEADAEAVLDAYSQAVVTVAEKVGPAVVNIAAVRRGTARTPRGPVPFEAPGGGSGVVIAPDGYLLTNSHVVHGAATIKVTLADGRSFAAELAGSSPTSSAGKLRPSASVTSIVAAPWTTWLLVRR